MRNLGREKRKQNVLTKWREKEREEVKKIMKNGKMRGISVSTVNCRVETTKILILSKNNKPSNFMVTFKVLP